MDIVSAERESRISLDWAREAWDGLEGLALLRAALTGPCAGRIALVSSFGAESAVLLDMVASIDRRTPVIFLETGKLFPETLAYKDELVRWLGLEDVRVIRPDPADLARFDGKGDLWRREADMCCHIRKTEPLDRALRGFVGWITGRKRFQGGLRAALPAVEADPVTGLLKLNPLASWSLEDIRHYRRLRQLPLHPLVARGYPSIGCAPCTRAVKEGEDVRAGRWWHLDKTECGIHRS
ncbi:phosphoadenylyl-sulfate reductase [Benzoatithermus flavus]|uniref:Adenosine 5'-phosphosulfate reductase n=1 Tax=Benzoatithermus flavus TaxID=3108223 RepID=A0ABU8XQL5_9PROT